MTVVMTKWLLMKYLVDCNIKYATGCVCLNCIYYNLKTKLFLLRKHEKIKIYYIIFMYLNKYVKYKFVYVKVCTTLNLIYVISNVLIRLRYQ